MDINDIDNGHEAVAQAIQAMHEPEVVLPPATVRRLARLQARMQGAEEVAQAAVQAAQRHQAALQQALNEACEEEGLVIPDGATAPVDIDWRTGRLRIRA
jgi:hypothetical protein